MKNEIKNLRYGLEVLLDKYIVTSLFTESNTQTTYGSAGLSAIDLAIQKYVDIELGKVDFEVTAEDRAQLIEYLTTFGREQYQMYRNDNGALLDSKMEYGYIEDFREPLDTLSDTEQDAAEFEAQLEAQRNLYLDPENQAKLAAAMNNILSGTFYGVSEQYRTNIGAKGFGTESLTTPLFQQGVESNIYSDLVMTSDGMTRLQDVQLLLIELGFLGTQRGDEDRTIFEVNQLDSATSGAIVEAMSFMNRQGAPYLPSTKQVIEDFKKLGVDTSILEDIAAGNTEFDIAKYYESVAGSAEGKQLFHNYFVTGLQKMITDKKNLGLDLNVIQLPSHEANLSAAKSEWAAITGNLMNPYLAAVAAQDINNIWMDVQRGEGAYMDSDSTANIAYKTALKEAVRGDKSVEEVIKPFSDPYSMIEQKTRELVTKMAIEDNRAFVEGAVNNSYGTNLWNVLSALG